MNFGYVAEILNKAGPSFLSTFLLSTVPCAASACCAADHARPLRAACFFFFVCFFSSVCRGYKLPHDCEDENKNVIVRCVYLIDIELCCLYFRFLIIILTDPSEPFVMVILSSSH